MNPDPGVFTSLKELDQTWRAPKGTGFRAFKHALPFLVANHDFIWLDAKRQHAEIENLRASGRIYAGSVNVVLLSDTGLQKLRRP